MMDLSDGLASDLCHILKLSKCGAEINIEDIPAIEGDIESAVCGGEDYKLLFTVEASAYKELTQAFEDRFHAPLYKIGRIVADDEPLIHWLKDGEEIALQWRGFSHF